MQVYLASKNNHKLKEISLIVPEWVELEVSPIDVHVDENGETFYENSIKKALFYGFRLNKPVVADDSGLCIEALGSNPGVQSARYLEGKSYEEKMKILLEELKDAQNRNAKFVCCASFFDPTKDILISVQEEVRGKIAFEIRGVNGFGYDPFFIPEGYDKTFGELGEEVKNQISHRAKAIRKLFEQVKKLYF